MIIRKLKLLNFRNYAQLELTFSTRTNVIYGANAQGKSNLLEALHCLSLTRGFRTTVDQELLKFGAEGFEISGEYVDERGSEHLVVIQYQQGEQGSNKQISLNRKRLNSHAAVVGKFPLVLFSPESHRITAGPPAERRRFLDMLLSQGAAIYLADLQEYNRILRQRNTLLAQFQKAMSRTGCWQHGMNRWLYTGAISFKPVVNLCRTTLNFCKKPTKIFPLLPSFCNLRIAATLTIWSGSRTPSLPRGSWNALTNIVRVRNSAAKPCSARIATIWIWRSTTSICGGMARAASTNPR
jgi:hypothetical protein